MIAAGQGDMLALIARKACHLHGNGVLTRLEERQGIFTGIIAFSGDLRARGPLPLPRSSHVE